MRLLVFGSRNLTARHLPAMRKFIAAESMQQWHCLPREPSDTMEGFGERPMPLPLDLIMRAHDSADI